METISEAGAGWAWVELHGGPRDGHQAWCRVDDAEPGTALLSDLGAYGPGGRSWYEPDADGTWRWQGDTP